ncbi:toxin-antitoxin system HicB family antitoxin [Roseomonas chloroacetimidivorans]|uniref:toxin-antitoxin system HicB family antitoxin n=1 Tax=Roseomonas chloroacetimidivorans TaxID=1766656 RepID=UPI003C7254D6
MDDDVRFTLRLPAALHAQLAEAAERSSSSLNKFMTDSLAERVGGPTSILVALRQADAAIRAARSLVRNEDHTLALLRRDNEYLEQVQLFLLRLLEEKGVQKDQIDKAWDAHFENASKELRNRKKPEILKHERERLEFLQERLEREKSRPEPNLVSTYEKRIEDRMRLIADLEKD